jgi:hypothetical protein
MTHTRRWDVQIFIDEHDDGSTRAEARLRTGGNMSMVGVGFARQNPHDTAVPEIGDELAVARALSNLGRTPVAGVGRGHRERHPRTGPSGLMKPEEMSCPHVHRS